MENVFLTTESGLTSTSANHLANIAKECCKNAEKQLENINFVNTKIELITGDQKTLQVGLTSVVHINTLIEQIANMKAFCAWIREAIKAKDLLLRNIYNLSISQYEQISGKSYPDKPESPEEISDSVIISEMSIKDRNNYLRLEAFASAYSSIHPGGTISDARDKFYEKLNNPTSISGQGRDLIIYTYTPSLSSSDIENMFMQLQSKHRNYEKQLNAIKFHIKDEVNKRNIALKQKYQEELAEYSKKVQEFNNEMSIYKTSEYNRLSALKIVIPDKLRETYEYLESLK